MLAGIVMLAGALLAARPAARLLAHRFGCSARAAAGLVIAIGAALAVTLWSDARPSAPFLVADRHYFVSQLTTPGQWWAAVSTIGGSGEELAVIALFVPAGFLAHLVFRRPTLTVPAGVLLSAAVEALQNVAGRSGDLNDVSNSAAGMVVGTLLAAATIPARRAPSDQEHA